MRLSFVRRLSMLLLLHSMVLGRFYLAASVPRSKVELLNLEAVKNMHLLLLLRWGIIRYMSILLLLVLGCLKLKWINIWLSKIITSSALLLLKGQSRSHLLLTTDRTMLKLRNGCLGIHVVHVLAWVHRFLIDEAAFMLFHLSWIKHLGAWWRCWCYLACRVLRLIQWIWELFCRTLLAWFLQTNRVWVNGWARLLHHNVVWLVKGIVLDD